MNSKFALALIALVGVGVFALPSTMALFAGQHSFYNIDATGNQVPCQKCHGDVKAELTSGGYQPDANGAIPSNTKGPHAEFKCEYCHRAESGFASGDDAYAKIPYEAVDGNGSVYLVTTVANFESGNFPKSIVSPSGLTVDNWNGNVYNDDGTQFQNQTELLDKNGQYAGSLSSVSGSGTTFNYSSEGASESSTHNKTTGLPIDTNTNTQNNAFNPRLITWGGSKGQTVNLTGAGSRMVTPGTKYHAASLVSCLECHGGDQERGAPGYTINGPTPYNHKSWVIDETDPNSKCANCHYGNPDDVTGVTDQLMAGGFGLTDAPNDTGSVEAHNDFVKANGGVLRKGYGAANDACVACHTHVAVDINFQKKYALKFDATAQHDSPGDNKSWSVGGFSAKGTVTVESFGNGTGGAFAIGNHSYNWTPDTNIYLVNPNGTLDGRVSGLNNTANDSSGALSPTP